jgi:hypothetical protein
MMPVRWLVSTVFLILGLVGGFFVAAELDLGFGVAVALGFGTALVGFVVPFILLRKKPHRTTLATSRAYVVASQRVSTKQGILHSLYSKSITLRGLRRRESAFGLVSCSRQWALSSLQQDLGLPSLVMRKRLRASLQP